MKPKKIWVTIFLILILVSLGILYLKTRKFQPENSNDENIETPQKTPQEIPKNFSKPVAKPKTSQIQIKSYVNLNVPFTSQAPYTVWDDLHNNACEEASVIIVDHYLKGKSLFKEIAEKEIQAMVAWQVKNLGRHHDLTASQTAQYLVHQYLGYKKAEVKAVNNVGDIKRELSEGNPVIVPAAGRMLDNPNFRRPGPLYHMLVVRGYNSSQFITNDPGTRKGEGYLYSYGVLFNAIHDWNGGDVNNGKKVMIIID